MFIKRFANKDVPDFVHYKAIEDFIYKIHMDKGS